MIVRGFPEERMAPIISELKTKEFTSGIRKRQVITERNLIYLANFRQQHVTIDVQGMERMSFYDEESWVAQEVEAYLYFEILNFSDEIRAEKIKEQLFYRIIKHKLHIGIKPGAEYEVIIVKENDISDCLIKVKYYSNVFCPDFDDFVWELDKINNIIAESIVHPDAELTSEDVESFLTDGEEMGFYNDDEDDSGDDSSDYFDGDRDDDSGEGDDYQEYDEEYEMERSMEMQDERIKSFFFYANFNSDSEEDEVPLPE